MAKVVAVQKKDGQHVLSEPFDDDAVQAEYEKVLNAVQSSGHRPERMIQIGSRAAVRAGEITQVTIEPESFGKPMIG